SAVGGQGRGRLLPTPYCLLPRSGVAHRSLRGGGLLEGEGDQTVPAGQRNQVGVDLAQGAVVAQFDQLVGRQGLQLVFRNRVVLGDLLRRGGAAVGIARREGRLPDF